MSAAGARAGGFVLVGVLLVLLAIGLIAVAMSLEAGLTTLGARAAAGAAEARTAARSGLMLALDEVRTAVEAGGEPPTALGPWDAVGVAAAASLAALEDTDPTVYRLRSSAVVGRSRAEASAAFVLEPVPAVLEWREP